MGAVNASRADVARLLGRAAFGATAADLDKWTGRRYVDLVDSLFPPQPADRRPPLADEVKRLGFESNDKADFTSARPMINWWMERMRSTPWPLEERMTYFWHDHFANALLGPPNISHMAKQNQTFRVHAFGDFRTLCNAMTVDGAMLYYLSGYRNTRGAVNENYGREFFELFTNGVLPQLYTENDVKEAAKAFSGWTVNATTRAGQFTESRHVLGAKLICGRTVGGYPAGDARNATEYQEVTEAALALPTAARFVAYKLVVNFGYVPSTRDVLGDPDPLIEKIAAALRPATPSGPWDIKAAVRTMLLADEWRYAPAAQRRQNVRAPIELIVHQAKLVDQSLDITAPKLSGTTFTNPLVNDFTDSTARAGQVVFYPPGVDGWANGLDWLCQAFNLGRWEQPIDVFNYWLKQGQSVRVALPPSADVGSWVKFVGLDAISPNTETAVRSYLASPGTVTELTRQAYVFVLLTNSPEWQVM